VPKLFVERRLEGKVEGRHRFDRGQSRQSKRHPHAPVLANGTFFDEQLFECLDTVDLALFDAPQCGIEHFESSRHTQRHQAVLDAVDSRSRGMDGHDRPPASASRSPIA
jgi:hypothetical protein